MSRERPPQPRVTGVISAEGDHPAVSDPRVYLTCACCIRRELIPVIEALRHGRHGKAKIILAKLWLGLNEQIEAAVAADKGTLQ